MGACEACPPRLPEWTAEQRKLLEKALDALVLDVSAAPNCMGPPSFATMEGRWRKYLDTLVDLQDVEALEKFIADMKRGGSKVVECPYSDPEDRYESMANDYGSDLADYYRKARQAAQKALADVRRAVEEKRPPAIMREDLEVLRRRRQEEEAEKRRRAEEAERAAKDEKERRLRQREDAVARIVSCLRSLPGAAGRAGESEAALAEEVPLGARASLREVLDECLAESSTWAGGRAFLAQLGLMVLSGAADVPGHLLALFLEHPLCVAGPELATRFWDLCFNSSAPASDSERRLRRAMALRFAEPAGRGEGERAQVQGASDGNALLLWACYRGHVGAVATLLDAYGEKLDSEAMSRRLQEELLNNEGLNALHMAVRVFGPGRADCRQICQSLVPFIDPSRKSREDKDAWDYLKMNQRKPMVDAITEVLRSRGGSELPQ